MTGTGSDGVTDSISFDLTVQLGCSGQTISSPMTPLVGQTYTVYDAIGTYTAPLYETNEPYCLMSYSIAYTPANSFMSDDGNKLEW